MTKRAASASVDGIALTVCLNGKCKRNCENLMCFNKLGEKDWLNNIQSVDSPEFNARKPNEVVGLWNLGATCYMNAVTQVLLRLPVFKRLLKWDPSLLENEELRAFDESNDGSVYPRSTLGNVIILMRLMNETARIAVDPSFLTRVLGLDNDDPQDASEFFDLFIKRCSTDLQGQRDPQLKNFFKNFSGKTRSHAECIKCGHNSEEKTVEFVYQMVPVPDATVKTDRRTLMSAFSGFPSEKVEVTCGQCKEEMGILHSSLDAIPPYLTFVVGRVDMACAKVGDRVSFPEKVCLREMYPHGPNEYRLVGVVFHRGNVPDEYHFSSSVWDLKNQKWQHFDDHMTKTKDDIGFNTLKSKRKPTVFTSESATMLFYLREDYQKLDCDTVEYPAWTDVFLQSDEKNFRKACLEKQQVDAEFEKSDKKKGEIIKKFYNDTLPNAMKANLLDWVLVPKYSIAHYFEVDTSFLSKFKVTDVECEHGKLHPTKILVFLKLVSPAFGAEVVKHGHSWSLRDVCEVCRKTPKMLIELRKRMRSDDALLKREASALKENRSAPAFWVCKEDYSNWKKRAEVEALEGLRNQYQVLKKVKREQKEYNSDACCSHSNRVLDENFLVSVTAPAWEILCKYFETYVEMPVVTEACFECVRLQEIVVGKTEERKELAKVLGESQTWAINPMMRFIPRVASKGDQVFFVPKEFAVKLKNFIINPVSAEFPSTLDMSAVLCEHGKVLRDPRCYEDFIPVESSAIKQLKKVSFLKMVSAAATKDHPEEMLDFQLDPELCDPCLVSEMQAEEAKQYVYKKQPFFCKMVSVMKDVFASILSCVEENDVVNVTKLTRKEPRMINMKETLGLISERKGKRGGKRMIFSSDMKLADVKSLVSFFFLGIGEGNPKA
ncbi:unnamed protein product [Notodromas monacha]|uniref:USP domain-containing protein n=1 Tax=Notodromas monacha TaxID=399045 RepID=A0A7R9BMV0_9CRUS|nr:unnamed protein product [Notodromas monacha]CAG0917054.1 unnamed protein product [Notodromas monacha]